MYPLGISTDPLEAPAILNQTYLKNTLNLFFRTNKSQTLRIKLPNRYSDSDKKKYITSRIFESYAQHLKNDVIAPPALINSVQHPIRLISQNTDYYCQTDTLYPIFH